VEFTKAGVVTAFSYLGKKAGSTLGKPGDLIELTGKLVPECSQEVEYLPVVQGAGLLPDAPEELFDNRVRRGV
jgi:hypothetical protein